MFKGCGKRGHGKEPSERQILPMRVLGRISEWKGTFGWIQPVVPVAHPMANRHHGKVFLLPSNIQTEISGVGALVSFQVYVDSTGLGALDCRPAEIDEPAFAPQELEPVTLSDSSFATQPATTFPLSCLHAFPLDPPVQKTIQKPVADPRPKWAPRSGQQGAGKGKGLGKGPSKISRERISEDLMKGRVLGWRGNVAWIKPAEPLRHPLFRGKIYLHASDVKAGNELPAGAIIKFHIYRDSQGLGAESASLVENEEDVVIIGDDSDKSGGEDDVVIVEDADDIVIADEPSVGAVTTESFLAKQIDAVRERQAALAAQTRPLWRGPVPAYPRPGGYNHERHHGSTWAAPSSQPQSLDTLNAAGWQPAVSSNAAPQGFGQRNVASGVGASPQPRPLQHTGNQPPSLPVPAWRGGPRHAALESFPNAGRRHYPAPATLPVGIVHTEIPEVAAEPLEAAVARTLETLIEAAPTHEVEVAAQPWEQHAEADIDAEVHQADVAPKGMEMQPDESSLLASTLLRWAGERMGETSL